MFSALLKIRLRALLSSFRKGGLGRLSGGRTALIALLAVYVIGCFLFLFGSLFASLCRPLTDGGLTWLYFSLAGILATVIAFLGSVFSTQSQLYEAKDNELLLALPVPPRLILASRLAALLVMNFLLELLVLLPCIAVYGYFYPLTAAMVLLFLPCALLLPLLSTGLSCAVGALLALISSRVRRKSLFTTLASLAFLAAYFYGYSQAGIFIRRLAERGAAIAEAIRRVLPPLYYFGAALGEGDLTAFALFALCMAALFALVIVLLSRSFLGIATRRTGTGRRTYRRRRLRAHSPGRALLGRELRRFWQSPAYLLNSGFGSVMALVAAGALLWRGRALPALLAALSFPAELLPLLVTAALCLLASGNLITAPSVSLEGKSLWLLQSIPVSAGAVLRAKAACHLVITLPPLLVTTAAAAAVLRLPASALPTLILAPAAMAAFTAAAGLAMNLRFPRLNWSSETAAVKQSMSVLLTMLITLSAVFLPALAYALALYGRVSPGLFAWLYTALLALLTAALALYLRRGGARRFREL